MVIMHTTSRPSAQTVRPRVLTGRWGVLLGVVSPAGFFASLGHNRNPTRKRGNQCDRFLPRLRFGL